MNSMTLTDLAEHAAYAAACAEAAFAASAEAYAEASAAAARALALAAADPQEAKAAEDEAWAAWETAINIDAESEDEETAAWVAEEKKWAALAAEDDDDEEGALSRTLADMSEPDRDWACGEDTPDATAQAWINQGFTGLDWLISARCFCPRSARALADHGITPEEASTAGPDDVDTVGYAVANGDMSAVSAAELCTRR